MYLVNSFSLGMVSPDAKELSIKIEELDVQKAQELLSSGFKSYIGHESTANALSQLLSTPIPANRSMLILPKGNHKLLLAQVMVRLPEGAVLTKEEILKLYADSKIRLLLLHLEVR